jgi:hypothetical protein
MFVAWRHAMRVSPRKNKKRRGCAAIYRGFEMVHGPAVEAEKSINPDQISRIEIARSASAAEVEVRVFVADVKDPVRFAFANMRDAIRFYERLWAQRGVEDSDAAAPHTA